jgi:hypothetical protein
VDGNLKLLRRYGRREISRRLVLLCALFGMLLLAPAATSVPGDPTPPVVTPIYSPALPPNGWFRGTVTLNWSVVDPESIILSTTGCGATTLTADTAGTNFTCSAESDGGISGVTAKIKLDKTVPSVAAIAERVPDANGWYNKPFTVSFTGSDVTSGLASCSAATRYSGPDNPGASMAGFCTDVAGNVAGVSLPFKYDATAPTLFAVTTKLGNRSALVTWRKSTDTQVVEVLRAPGRKGEGESVVYSGTATGFIDKGLAVGRKYEYRVAGIDAAANRSERQVALVATGPLLSPTPGATVKRPPPFLDWIPVKRASYYNLQIVRGRKVLSAWPAQSSFRLRRTWSYNGRRYRLSPGVYRWYVWPGYGRISASRYGRLLGSSTFVVTK